MFKDRIGATPMTTDIADSYFTHIQGQQILGDVSFLSTLRALVDPRIGKDRIELRCWGSNLTKATIGSHRYRDVINAIMSDGFSSGETGKIYIHNFSSYRQEDVEAAMTEIEEHFTSYIGGDCQRIKKVTDFYRSCFKVLCYISKDNKNVFLFVDNLDVKKLHYLQCSIFAILPWYFDPEDGVSELEMRLINSLREKTPENYLKCLAEIAFQGDFRTKTIRKLLADFESQADRREIEALKRNVRTIIDDINSHNESIGRSLARKREAEVKLLGLELKVKNDGENSEIMEYFLCNNKLVLISASGSELKFACKDYLTYYDDEMAKKMIDNSHSYIYEPDDDIDEWGIDRDDMKELMYAIFVDQKLRIKMCAAYSLVLNDGVRPISRWDYGSEFADCIPNTHIDRYACLGNYRTVMNELLLNNDYIGAIEQCVASCKSLNFGDSVVMCEFMKALYGEGDVNNRCIELPDGRTVEPKEAIEWLHAEKENEQEA